MEIIEKRHNSCMTEVFYSQTDLEKHESECALYRIKFDEVLKEILYHNPDGCNVYAKFGSFCPWIQHVTFNASGKDDMSNIASDSGIFLRFDINFKSGTIEVENCGYIDLSSADKAKSHLCMCSMKKAHIALGGKWMRKSRIKSAENAASKMTKFYNEVMKNVSKATGGYPYKEMLINIY